MMDNKKVLMPPRFTIKDVTVHEKTRLFKKHFALDEYIVSYKTFDGGETKKLAREIFERDQDAVAILPYDSKSDEVVLIEQFRPGALKDPLTPWLFEIVAGMIDEGETEIEAAKRELKEEAGLEVPEENFHYINAVYPSPGGVSERLTLYVALVGALFFVSHLETTEKFIGVISILFLEIYSLKSFANSFCERFFCFLNCLILFNTLSHPLKLIIHVFFSEFENNIQIFLIFCFN